MSHSRVPALVGLARKCAARLRAQLQRQVVLPFALLIRGEHGFWEELERIRRVQWDANALERLRGQRLGSLLGHAQESVRFYKDRVAAAQALLSDFPILTKDDLVDFAAELRAPGLRSTGKTTGGSTGRAVTVWKNPDAIASERAATALAFGWYGIRAGDPAVRLWGTGGRSARRRKARLADLAMNRRVFSAFAFADGDLEAYWKELEEYQPVYLYGYVSMLEALARFAVTKGRSPPEDPPKVVLTTSEPLYDASRSLISAAFAAPVRNEYGCGEVGPIAYECPTGTLHLMESNLWLEVVDDHGNDVPFGDPGRLLITDLRNLAMPLIRYDVGDTVRLGPPCECGRSFRTLAEVKGRMYDMLLDGQGRRYHGEAVMYVFEELRTDGVDVQAFQVTQKEAGSAVVRFTSRDQDLERVAGRIRLGFRRLLGSLEVEAIPVSAIQAAPSGKRRLIVNEVSPRNR